MSSLLRIIGVSAAIIAVFMIAESFDKMNFIGQGMTLPLLAEYLFLKVPFMITDFMPAIVLIACAIYMTEISHHHELVVLRAAGVSMSMILAPLLAAAACAGLITFVMGEWVEPITNERVAYMDRVYIGGKKPVQHGSQWLRGDKMFLQATLLRDNYFSLMLLKTDEQGKWLERIDASKAHYQEGAWHMQQVYVSRLNGDSAVGVEKMESLRLSTHLSPETVSEPSPRDMRLLELYSFTKALVDAGLDAREYEYYLHRKITAPLSCLLMAILAYSLCANMGSRIAANSKGLALAISLGLAFYVFNSMIMTISAAGTLPVAYAAWWPTILFTGIAGYILLHREGY